MPEDPNSNALELLLICNHNGNDQAHNFATSLYFSTYIKQKKHYVGNDKFLSFLYDYYKIL